MTNPIRLAVCVVACVLLTFSAALADNEEEIPLDRVPKSAIDAVKKKFPDCKLHGAIKGIHEKKPYFEFELTHKQHEYRVATDPKGKILEIDKDIPLKELPKAVVDALKKKYPSGKLESAEEVTDDDGITYAVIVKLEKRTVEVEVGPKGRILDEQPIDE